MERVSRERDRYRRGTRRTSAEPLTASWKPDPADDGEASEERVGDEDKRGLRGAMAAYGWRIYALPVLVVITALVVWNTANDTSGNVSGGGVNDVGSADAVLDDAGTQGDPGVSEAPQTPVNVNIPTAVLPEGGPFTQRGAHSWRVIPGTTPRVGTSGKLYKYTIEVEDGINPAEYGGDDAFAKLVDETLDNQALGWTSVGVSVQRVDPKVTNPDFRISLTTPDTTHGADLCGQAIQYEASCRRASAGRVVLNLARWVRGALAFGGDLLTYRQYATNHEVGHAFGNGHVGCPNNGDLAPVMMQQSFGVSDDYVAQLNNVPGGDRNSVPADGKVCRPNAWPNPQARPAAR